MSYQPINNSQGGNQPNLCNFSFLNCFNQNTSSSHSEDEDPRMAQEPVILNVYDMFWTNEYTSSLGIGVFHSGVEVYGTEYAYGGHPFPFSGTFEIVPRDAENLGPQFKFKESLHIGFTDFTDEDVKNIVESMSSDYRGDKYHLINRNCNHFCNELSKVLCGREIPSWVNRLASMSNYLPFIEKWLPKEWLTPVALEHSLETSISHDETNDIQSS
ncbi:deubiquitinase DESI2-like [Artemia franciscana]|uniref:deubiquitinase DESI2-like n=1 Tax=Artemia franciscana TaxID=6661 RepID=UPI0032D9E4FA